MHPRETVTFHVKQFLQRSDAAWFSGRILDAELRPNWRMFDVERGAEPIRKGHPRAVVFGNGAAGERNLLPRPGEGGRGGATTRPSPKLGRRCPRSGRMRVSGRGG
jgi:hypothetical protein